ncbi:hypothetical protein pb186bvf_009586 [Paramecium bursaria]
MNKFTLRFFNNQLEPQFQNQQKEKQQKILILMLSVVCSIFQAINIFWSLGLNEMQRCYVSIFFFTYMGSSFIIFYSRQKFYKFYFHISNVVGLLAQLDYASLYSPHEYYLYGANMMTLHLILLITCDFPDAIIQFVLQTTGRIMITYYLAQHFDVRNYIGSYGIGALLLGAIYQNQQMARQQFLLNLKDQKWLDFLPNIINKPMFLFDYSSQNLQFTTTNYKKGEEIDGWNKDIDVQKNFRAFLENCKIGKQNLMDFLFTNLIKQQNVENPVRFKLNNKQYALEIYDLGLQNTQSYLMIIDLCRNEQLIKKELQYTKYIKNYQKSLERCIKTFDYKKVVITNKLFICLFHMNSMKIQLLNLNNVIKKISQMFAIIFNSDIKVLFDRQMNLNTYSERLQSLITLILFECLSTKQKTIRLNFICPNDDFIVMNLNIADPFTFFNHYKSNNQLLSLEKDLLVRPLKHDMNFYFIQIKDIKFI